VKTKEVTLPNQIDRQLDDTTIYGCITIDSTKSKIGF